MKTEGRGEAAGPTEGPASTWAPACGAFQHIEITRDNSLTRLIKLTSHPAYLLQTLTLSSTPSKFKFGFITITAI